ncbi:MULTISPECIES: DNA polymerase III subunit epsilon [Tepidiphilus]|jgi:DNA polymerase-3 subunit epsilon|uniref:DNA polymerase III subunit epsilon n=1 Tax=Tepidiphilus thermophilus TaxID=876478 RepID=A0A0K6IR33_9PROT|nr:MULTISPECIES: DNA polymerase III subunit epsilon [Tepidiphilus]MDK2797064.1 polymerase subunit epsilon [Tepidiphilus sp.]CUB05556.1 DNA polymerase III, epsilon subunit, Proteobacterial [Tepidiphilus thermophilus]
MHQIVLDTETTGLDWKNGDRIIEIGCVELLARRLTDNRFHRYLNPERSIDAGAVEVHGITDEMLRDAPRFADIVDEFLDYVRGAELIIHNAAFDLGFLNAELSRLGRDPIETVVSGVIDTLKLAKTIAPGKKASLDALCERYGIDNRHRTLHGALLDAELLAEVYLAMTRGQETLMLDAAPAVRVQGGARRDGAPRPALRVLRASEEELVAHEAVLAEIDQASGGKTLWRTLTE